MAISSWVMWGGRSLRSNRPFRRTKQENEETCIEFDLSKDLKKNLTECLLNICLINGISSAKKLAYLNAIVKLINESDTLEYGYNTEELFCCVRVGLVHEATQVRAATLRAVRYLLRKEQDVIALNKLQYPYFIARSLDVNIRNEVEKIQALRLIRRILVLAPKHFSSALARSLICIASGGLEEKDRSFRVYLAVLCELGVLNPNVFVSCGGVGALARASIAGQSPAISEAIVGVLLRLLGNPETRGSVSLLCLAAPYCELESIKQERTKEDWDQRFAASKHALLSVLRSYTGLIHFCHPNENSGLKAIADILYVEKLEVRGAVLELLYELLGLPLPTWTDEPDVALAAVDPSRYRSSWKLSEGFVAAEGLTILPSLMSHCPNITELHQALLVYVLLECELHKALAKTIISSDTFISVRAAVLLGALLHLAHLLLPAEVCDLTPPLPNLLEQASAGSHQALAAVTILSRMHAMMRIRPSPASLFMDRMLQAGNWMRPVMTRSLRRQSSLRNWIKRESPLDQLMRDSQVLSAKDALAWNWSAVRSIIRARDESFRTLQDSNHRAFIKKLVKYFKPSSNQYSRIELSTYSAIAREATLAGCDVINFLLELQEPDGTRYMNELLIDIAEQLMALRIAQSAHDCLFSPRLVTSTCCQKYFLFLGQLSYSPRGTMVLRTFNLLDKMLDLALTTKHDCYVKLIVSSLDYTREGPNRRVLSKIVQDAALESTRAYATQFLRILLRIIVNDIRQWAFGLLLQRLNDKSRTVALLALEALHEACEEPELLELMFRKSEDACLENWDQWLNHLGDRGHLLKMRLYSIRSAFIILPSPSEELERWIRPGGQSERYAGLVECEIHDSLTRRQRDESGSYIRRSSGNPHMPKNVFIPPHLIGQLVQHDLGLQMLLRRNVLQRFARIVQRFKTECGGALIGSGLREESKEDRRGELENNRLETIVDSEGEDKPQELKNAPQKIEPNYEIRRKLSQDDSRRTTPEKNSRNDTEPSREDYVNSFEGRIVKVKSALWSLGHAGTSCIGAQQLDMMGIIELITVMAESCPHYSVKATAMYALSLVGTSRSGAEILQSYGWPCVRHSRSEHWPVIQPTTGSFSINRSPSPIPMQRHHRSMSDGKPELPEFVAALRRQRNRSESAAADLEPPKKYPLPERAETPSPLSSVQRLSQQDADGYARLRSLQRHRRPSFSQSSLEMADARLSLQSLTECELPRSWNVEPVFEMSSSPKHSAKQQQRKISATQDTEDDIHPRYMGISLPHKLSVIFPEATPTNALLEKINKSRYAYESRRGQNASTSESSVQQDDILGTSARTLKADLKQNDSDSEYLSPIPAILLDQENKVDNNSDGALETYIDANVNDSDSECAGPSNRLALPRGARQKNNSVSDADDESSSEYEQPNDHSRLCLICYKEKSISNDSVTTERDFRRSIDKTRRDVLKHALRLANPVYYRQSRQTLLRLRQKYPNIFQETCIYSEVAARLANNTYRLQARRFLQELFLDSSFEILYDEPIRILRTIESAMENGQSSDVPTSPLDKDESPAHQIIVEATVESKINGRMQTDSDYNLQQSSELSSPSKEPTESQSIERLSSYEENYVGKNSETNESSQLESIEERILTVERPTDEMIIADILKPDERIKSKATDKMIKATGINTAISLD